VILITLLLQGLTLPYIIRKSKLLDDLIDEKKEEESKRKMKYGLRKHVHQFLKDKYEHEHNGHVILEKMMKFWEERAEDEDDKWMTDEIKKILFEMLESQRQYLDNLNNDPNIDEEIIRHQLFQIDLEEERLRIV
jgi:CPA1 family monovalent cation:H+ antiporter